jgi:hypothetical protein
MYFILPLQALVMGLTRRSCEIRERRNERNDGADLRLKHEATISFRKGTALQKYNLNFVLLL